MITEAITHISHAYCARGSALVNRSRSLGFEVIHTPAWMVRYQEHPLTSQP